MSLHTHTSDAGMPRSFSGVCLRPLLAKRFVGRRLGGMSACGARRMTKPQGGLGMMSSVGGGTDVISGPPPQPLVRIDALGAICCGSHVVDPQPGLSCASGVWGAKSMLACRRCWVGQETPVLANSSAHRSVSCCAQMLRQRSSRRAGQTRCQHRHKVPSYRCVFAHALPVPLPVLRTMQAEALPSHYT